MPSGREKASTSPEPCVQLSADRAELVCCLTMVASCRRRRAARGGAGGAQKRLGDREEGHRKEVPRPTARRDSPSRGDSDLCGRAGPQLPTAPLNHFCGAAAGAIGRAPRPAPLPRPRGRPQSKGSPSPSPEDPAAGAGWAVDVAAPRIEFAHASPPRIESPVLPWLVWPPTRGRWAPHNRPATPQRRRICPSPNSGGSD